MDNKLSELSKPFLYGVIDTDGKPWLSEFCVSTNAEHLESEVSAENEENGPDEQLRVSALYSQEYASALLAELEAKDKRIAELERANKSQDDHINQQQDRIDSLEKKNAGLGSALGSTEKLLEDRLEKWQELASNQVIKINELQAKLATPVRLPTTSGRLGVAYTRVIPEVIEAIRAAGFKCVGDE